VEERCIKVMDSRVNRYLDQAVLKPELTQKEVEEAIKLGLSYDVRNVCVRPCDVEMTVALCKGTSTSPGCVLSFPHGHECTEGKKAAAELYIKKGIEEIDMVANYGYIKSGRMDLFEKDVQAVSELTSLSSVILKVILETSMLTSEEITKAVKSLVKTKADFVKTSTGFSTRGASKEDIDTIMKAAEGKIFVKASAGIRDYEKVMEFINLGCTRIGVNYTSVPIICKQ
jgi:deoxyribose-phosphate aldolase